ncbi:hypothetical protein ACFWGM_36625, partial [Streptomyces roseolus]
MPEQPPYLRIADELRRRIAEHEWSPGDRLPSRAQIGQMVPGRSVAWMVDGKVRAAMDVLFGSQYKT